MRLVWAVPCDSCDLHEDGTASIYGAGFDAFAVESFPAVVPFTVVLGLLLEEDEKTEIEMTVIGPVMSGVQSLSHPVSADPRPSHVPGNFVSQIELIDAECQADRPGGYSIEVYGSDPAGTGYSFFFSVFEG